MPINIALTQFDSRLAGLGNYESASFYFQIPSHTVPAFSATRWNTTWPMSNDNAISAIQINYAGLETVWRYVSGVNIIMAPTYAAPTYQIQTYGYYQGGQLKISTLIIDQTGLGVSISEMYVNVRAFLYNAPF